MKRWAQEIEKIFLTVAGQVKHSFEKQVLEKVLSSDVEDKGIPGPDLGDVGEVLIRPHAEINSALDAQFPELGNRVEVRSLVRNKVVVPEITAALRDPLDEFGKLAGCEG